jgi:hypothetical protein
MKTVYIKFAAAIAALGVALPAFALDLKAVEGHYILVKDRYGMCDDEMNAAMSGNDFTLGSFYFRDIDAGTMKSSDSAGTTIAHTYTKGDTLIKERKTHAKGSGEITRELTRVTFTKGTMHLTTQDLDIPATYTECSYRKE